MRLTGGVIAVALQGLRGSVKLCTGQEGKYSGL
jgi:hypothetical protein